MTQKSRRETQSEETRKALLAAGHALFGAAGYGQTSAQQIVAQANVTRGALYHHFPSGKLGLFEAVATEVQLMLAASITTAAIEVEGSWDSFLVGLEAYFDVSADPGYQQIILQDGPAVLGLKAWRALEYQYSVAYIQAGVERLIAEGVIEPVSAESLASIIFGACSEATLVIGSAQNPQAARETAMYTLTKLLSGLKVVRF